MPKLSPEQKKKLTRLVRIVEDEEFGIGTQLIELDERIEKVETKVSTLKNGIDGKDGSNYVLTPEDKKEIAQSITVPVVEKVIEKTERMVENQFVLKGSEIVAKLESLPKEESLPIEAIKDLREELDKLKKIRSTGNSYSFFGGGGGGGGGRIVKVHDLTDQLNGVLKTFSLPAFWRIISVNSSSFPFVFRPTTDYTVSGTSITFTSEIEASTTLAASQTLLVIYSE